MEPKPPNVLIAYDRSEPSRRALDRVRTFMPNASVAGAVIIVLRSRGLNPLKRLVLGSVSTKVLHQAPCDVLVVK
jgi:universal stress protein family protein